MKKKVLSLTLAMAMCIGLTAPAFAAQYAVTEVIPLQYDYVGSFSEGLAAVGVSDGHGTIDKFGFIDKTGKIVVPYQYDEVYSFSDGIALVATYCDEDGFNDKWNVAYKEWAFIDKTGKVVIPCPYDTVWDFSDGFARVSMNGKEGYIDKTGKEVIPLQYDGVGNFSEGLAPASPSNDARYGYIDKTGKMVISYQYTSANCFSDGLALVYMMQNNRLAYIDRTGKEVILIKGDGVSKYDEVWDFSEGLAAVCLDDKWGYIDKTGKEVVPCQYDELYPFSDGFARVSMNGEWGYIDKTGKEVVPCQYDNIYPFSDGFAPVCLNSKWGYIDKTGKEAIPCQYDYVGSFSEGLAPVSMNGKGGFISISSTISTQPQQPANPSKAETASPTNDSLTVNGILANPTVYKINGNNYFKIRDLAAVLNGTEKQFDVGYDGALKSVTATTGKGYVKQSGDLAGAATGGNQSAAPSNDAIYIDGQKIDAAVYKINGSNYFKLRDLGKALNFYVGYDKSTGVFIDTSKPYSE